MSTLLLVLKTCLNSLPDPVWRVLYLLLDVLLFHLRRFWRWASSFVWSPVRIAKRDLYDADLYLEWIQRTAAIDRLLGAYVWRHNYTSTKYDFHLIGERLKLLQESRASGDPLRIISVFRQLLIRNFGGIASKELFTKLYAGTKTLIEDYIAEVLTCLDFVDKYELHRGNRHHHDMNPAQFRQMKLDFFHDARQSFGATALILQGGSLFGLCHLGVVKALYFKGLLPRIVSGNAVGGAVAALVCSLADQDLIPVLVNLAEQMRDSNIAEWNTDVDERYGLLLENIIVKGYSQDVLLFLKFVREQLGDLTFEESYARTEKVLNITINPLHPAIPQLLNYVTLPNMVIWSAIYALIGTRVLLDRVLLYIKNISGEVVPYETPVPEVVFYPLDHAQSRAQVLPYQRLTDLFNVNHFVILLARPYLLPLIGNDIRPLLTLNRFMRKVQLLVAIELQYRFQVLLQLHRLPRLVARLAVDEQTPRTNTGEITIVPELKYYVKDVSKLFEVHNYVENMPYWIKVGEKATWGVFGLLWVRCAVEFALDDLYALNRKARHHRKSE